LQFMKSIFQRITSGTDHTWSMWSVMLCWGVLIFFRFNPIHDKPISWDTLGYYLPLASTFVHNDPLLKDKSWLTALNEREHLTGTLYQITQSPDGKDMYFFFLGWSYCYAPFFAIGQAAAEGFGYPTDGFSWPYQLALMIGGLIYMFIGLCYWRKLLLHFYSDRIAAIAIFFFALATNFVNHASIDNLSTVNLLFMLLAVLLWNTVQWYEKRAGRNLVMICFAWALMTLIKPSETLACLIPLLWGVRWRSPSTWFTAIAMAWKSPYHLALGVGLALLLFLPQSLYWHTMTGRWIFDSYQNPGVGLDWTSPHIFNVLFSYRKGWFVYTPIVVFAFLGWIFFYRKQPLVARNLMICFGVFFYIVASWTEWWYGGGYSQRTLIPYYSILSLGFAGFVEYILGRQMVLRLATYAVFTLLLCLNQFQWWQFKQGVLDPYRTTKEYYQAIWLKKQAPAGGDSLKLVNRDFTGRLEFDSTGYRLIQEIYPDTKMWEMASIWDAEWMFDYKNMYNKWTNKDHLWMVVDAEIEVHSDDASVNPPLLVFFTEHKGAYGYRASPFERQDTTSIYKGTFVYMTPEMRQKSDLLGTHIWNRQRDRVQVRKWILRVYEPK
jgi:hypothetical protein